MGWGKVEETVEGKVEKGVWSQGEVVAVMIWKLIALRESLKTQLVITSNNKMKATTVAEATAVRVTMAAGATVEKAGKEEEAAVVVVAEWGWIWAVIKWMSTK
jgi:hypothetical protein